MEGKLGSAGGDLSFDLNGQIKGKADKMRASPLNPGKDLGAGAKSTAKSAAKTFGDSPI